MVIAGRWRDLLILDPNSIEVRVDILLGELGRRTFHLSPEHVVHPDDVEVRSVFPESVKIVFQRDGEPAGGTGKED